MNTPLLFAAMLAVAPPLMAAQEPRPDAAPAQPHPNPGCTDAGERPRAASALPARAATRPEPQRGSVAASGRVASHADTPSHRAMAEAAARTDNREQVEKKEQDPCAAGPARAAPENGEARSAGA